MAAKNLSSCLGEDFGIPTDVRFLFQENNSSDKTEVKAHKLILSLASEVFKREFYGSMQESGEGILIVDASQEVFSAMVQFIYNKEMDWSRSTYSFNFLSSLFYLAHKYDVKELMEDILVSIPKKNTDKDAKLALDIAFLAEDNTILFPSLSEVLYDTAAVLLKQIFRHRFDKFISFYRETEGASSNSAVLDKLLKKMKILSHCSNCKQSPCQNGKGVTEENFVSNSRVSAAGLGRGNPDVYKLGEIVDSSRFTGLTIYGEITGHCSLDPTLYVYNCSRDRD
eukprot:GFUD01025634.1.p1 GENE.GFUD01025634.1~~GFUD01025634.1.p1  ORF type:complete len:282 (-),score=60.61 GFUD01025634.1:82-927(-)